MDLPTQDPLIHDQISGYSTAQFGNDYAGLSARNEARVHTGNYYGDVTNNYYHYQDVKRKRREDYTVAWICALADPEWQASRLMFDNTHDDSSMPLTKHQYRYGEINGHYVVMGCVQEAQIGSNLSAAVAAEMISLFPSLKFVVLVGLGSGVWSEHHDVRLGDVVVGLPDLDHDSAGLIQLDLSRFPEQQELQSGSLRAPPIAVVSAIDDMRSSPLDVLDRNLQPFVQYAEDLPQFSTRPKMDELFKSTQTYPGAPMPEDLVTRKTRSDGSSPQVHYGTIASVDQAVNDAKLRDELGDRWDVLCLEYEAAGLMEALPCVVVRGIGDYGDSHEYEEWRPYAAAVAAAWAKDLLCFLNPGSLEEVIPITQETVSISNWNHKRIQPIGIHGSDSDVEEGIPFAQETVSMSNRIHTQIQLAGTQGSDSDAADAALITKPSESGYRCIFTRTDGLSPTMQCDWPRKYVSQLKVHHLHSDHPGGPFGCCKKCFATGVLQSNELTGEANYERFTDRKQVADHEDGCNREICLDERCVNFDQEPPPHRPCRHKSRPTGQQIWRMWYRRAHDLDRVAPIPNPNEPAKSLDPSIITSKADIAAKAFMPDTYTLASGQDLQANSFIDSGLGSSIQPMKGISGQHTASQTASEIMDTSEPRSMQTAESTIDLPTQIKASLSLQFAGQLAKETKGFLKELLDLNDLRTLLRSYAMATKIAAGTDHTHRQAAKYVGRNSNDIVQDFEELMMANIQLESSRRVTSGDRMQDYLRPAGMEAQAGPQPIDIDQALMNPNRPGRENDDSPREKVEVLREKLEEARDFLFNSAEFQWLVQKVKILTSWSPKPTMYTDVRRRLVDHLARSDKPESLGLSVQWSIAEFLEQQYAAKYRDIGSIIVYCGHGDALYATHASAYLSKVWPNIGQDTIDCLQAAYTSQHSTISRQIRGCSIHVSLGRDFVDLSLSGNPASVLDIAEAVIWLATACRASDNDKCAAYCYPRLYQRSMELGGLLVTPAFGPIESMQNSAEGYCWLGMVRNPVIATGYPIPRRDDSEHQKGLEAPLSLLVGLSCANYATTFDHMFLIKGLFTALVPVWETATAVAWHFHRTDESPMTYDQASSFGLRNPSTTMTHLNISDLEDRRHFVGFWTGCADFLAGTDDAEIYRFHQSQSLPIDHATVTLTGFNITGGRYLTAGLAFAFGKKDRGIADVSGKMPFEMQIDQAMDKTVLFYGEEDQRGWLADGATALLHLTIAWMSLKLREERPYHLQKLQYMEKTGGPRAAKRALLANAHLQLYTKAERKVERVRTKDNLTAESSDPWDSAYASGSSSGNNFHGLREASKQTWMEWTFEDVAVRHWQLLEAMSASVGRQQDTKREISVKAPNLSPMIAGWEAWDIIKHKTNPKGEFELRELHLKPQAKGWLDFVEKRGTVVLLARTFGDLIKPTQTHPECTRSFPMPKDQSFLAIPLHLLEPEPQSRYSRLENLDHSKSCMQIGDYLYWHSFETGPNKCQCSSGLRCNIVSKMGTKALKSKGKTSTSTSFNLFKVYPNGATIIGDSRSAAKFASNTKENLSDIPSKHSNDANILHHSMSEDNDESPPANEEEAQAVAGAEEEKPGAAEHPSAASIDNNQQEDIRQKSARSKISAGKRASLRAWLSRRKRSAVK